MVNNISTLLWKVLTLSIPKGHRHPQRSADHILRTAGLLYKSWSVPASWADWAWTGRKLLMCDEATSEDTEHHPLPHLVRGSHSSTTDSFNLSQFTYFLSRTLARGEWELPAVTYISMAHRARASCLISVARIKISEKLMLALIDLPSTFWHPCQPPCLLTHAPQAPGTSILPILFQCYLPYFSHP